MTGISAASPACPDASTADLPGIDIDPRRIALFLDVDGTLLDIVDRPDQVSVPTTLVPLLERTRDRLGGALALLSGRALAELDRLFAPLCLPAGGLHGLQIRCADGRVSAPQADPALPGVLARAQAMATTLPGLVIEDKQHTLALHYRLAPQAAKQVQAQAQRWLDELGAGWTLQHGKAVVELRPAGCDKGAALAQLMHGKAFAGRQPVMIGDDLTDEHAFAMAARLGGFGMLVGPARDSSARFRLPDPASVHGWLADLAQWQQERTA